MKQELSQKVKRLVNLSLAFHSLNKLVESFLGLSLVQYYLLSFLRDRPGISPNALASSIGMHASSLTPSLKRLSSRHYLVTSEDPRDSRKKMITLTSTGKQALDRFEEGIEALLLSDLENLRMKKIRESGLLNFSESLGIPAKHQQG